MALRDELKQGTADIADEHDRAANELATQMSAKDGEEQRLSVPLGDALEAEDGGAAASSADGDGVEMSRLLQDR